MFNGLKYIPLYRIRANKKSYSGILRFYSIVAIGACGSGLLNSEMPLLTFWLIAYVDIALSIIHSRIAPPTPFNWFFRSYYNERDKFQYWNCVFANLLLGIFPLAIMCILSIIKMWSNPSLKGSACLLVPGFL